MLIKKNERMQKLHFSECRKCLQQLQQQQQRNSHNVCIDIPTCVRLCIFVCACVCADRNPPPKIPRAWLTPLPQPLALLLLCWRCCIITEFRNSPALRRQLRCFAAVIAAVLLCFNYSYFNLFNLFCISLVFCCCCVFFFLEILKANVLSVFYFPTDSHIGKQTCTHSRTLTHTHTHMHAHAAAQSRKYR